MNWRAFEMYKEIEKRHAREAGLAEGREEGREETEKILNHLYSHLLENGRTDDMKRALRDDAYRKQLLKELSLL